MAAGDTRTGDRQTDVTLCLRLDSNDTRSEADEIVAALKTALKGMGFSVPGRREQHVIDRVDEPVMVHTAQRGHRPDKTYPRY